MKRLWIAIFILFAMAGNLWGADVKISELTAATAVTADDLFVITDDPGGSPSSKKITAANMLTYFQAYNAALASIVGLTETSGGMPYFTGSNTWAVLASGTAGQMIKMGASYPEWTSSISLSSLDLTSAVLALPQGTGAGYATDGYVYWRTDTNRLFIGDGTATRAVAFADEILAPSTVTLTAAQLYGSRINNYGQTAIATITLPTAAEGMDTVFVFGTATSATYTVQATGANAMYYSGATAAGVRIAAPAVGNYFVLYSFKTGASAWSWILKDGQGTIATF